MIYLDNAATSLIKPVGVSGAVAEAMKFAASPGRGGHGPAMKAADIVFRCRESIAELFNVSEPERVVFTMNATHALNIAINSMVCPGTKVLISCYEHNSVLRPLVKQGAECIVAEFPLFDTLAAVKAFEEKIDEAELVICTHISNVFGFILPIYEIAELCREKGVPLIVDASQSAGVLDVDYERLSAAFIAFPGHKALFGPQGTGVLICGRDGEALLSGGSGSDSISPKMPDYLPDRHEAGTHNVPGIAGLTAGTEYVMSIGIEGIKQHEQMLLHECCDMLGKLEWLKLYTAGGIAQSGVLSFTSSLMESEELCRRLWENGICVRGGLHCAPLAHRMAGTLDGGTVRLSFSPFVTLENAREFCSVLQNLLHCKA